MVEAHGARTPFEAALLEVLFAANLDPDKEYTKPEILKPLKSMIDLEQHKKPVNEVKVAGLMNHLSNARLHFNTNDKLGPIQIRIDQGIDRG